MPIFHVAKQDFGINFSHGLHWSHIRDFDSDARNSAAGRE